MELGIIFITALAVGFSGAAMPGPLMTVTIEESVRRGFIAGPLLMTGHALLEILLVLLLLWGAAELLLAQQVQVAIALAGGAFLIYLGWTMFRDARQGRVSLQLTTDSGAIAGVQVAERHRIHPVLTGILVSLANPYWTIWWATIGLAYITTAIALGTTGLLAFMSGHLLADFTWYGFVSGAVAGGRRFLNQQLYRGIIAVCGVFLVVLGSYFVYSGLT